MKVGIFTRHVQLFPREDLVSLLAALAKNGIEYLLCERIFTYLKDHISGLGPKNIFATRADLPADLDLMISLGGDGTFLDAANIIQDKCIPIFGINYGRLGFLADANKQHIHEIIPILAARDYFTEQRIRLCVRTSHAGADLFHGEASALNDCAIKSGSTRSILRIRAFLDGQLLTSYWADGVIVSTPTGSTGYSLSCGGPIVFPETPCLLLTSIAPHNLNARPVILPTSASISFEVSARDSHYICSLDTRTYEIPAKTRITVTQQDHPTVVVKLREHRFLDTIKYKLLWGEDMRDHKSPLFPL